MRLVTVAFLPLTDLSILGVFIRPIFGFVLLLGGKHVRMVPRDGATLARDKARESLHVHV